MLWWFSLSEECISIYNMKYGVKPDECNREDLKLIKMFIEKGSKWMSKPMTSKIKLFITKKELLPYISIDEYDGVETVNISYSYPILNLGIKFIDSLKEDESNLVEAYRLYKKEISEIIKIKEKYS